jgi:hypothetical protein
MPSRRGKLPVPVMLALMAAGLLLIFFATQLYKTGGKFRPKFQKGMTYSTWNKDALGSEFSDNSLQRLAQTGTKWVAFVPTWYQAQYNSTEIAPHKEKTPSDEGLIHAIQKAHELGFKVMLKPHLDLSEGASVNWRGEIDFPNEAAWRPWFDSYKKFVVHYAKIAQEQKVEIFCVGTELTNAAWQEKLWRDVIANVRAVFSGPLTYAANWNEEYLAIKFWDALDYAALDPYFPLSESDRPSLEELKQAWQPIAAELDAWQQKIQKPVIFGEIGYKSIKGAAVRPWEDASGEIDTELQRDCYLAVLETFWDRPWFHGLYWWYWGTHEKMGGPGHRGFTPQNKPAEQLVTEWYRKRR